MQQFSRESIGFLMLCVCFSGIYTAQALGGQIAKLEKPTGASWFGFATATDGNYVVVGDYTFDAAISQNRGTAIVYRRDGSSWVQDAMLIPNSPEIQLYGYSVAIDQDLVVVGAYYDTSVCNPVGDCSMGSANVFRREAGSWVFEEKLFPTDQLEETRFGKYVSLSDGRALVSAGTSKNIAGEITGAIYVFRREGTNWVEEARLTPSDIVDGSAFIFSSTAQAIDGERLLIGARTIDGFGAAYVFHRVGTTWSEEAKLVPPDRANGDTFEFSVDLNGNVAVVAGAESNAFVYRRNASNWSFDGTLSNIDIVPSSIAQKTLVNADGINILVTTIFGNSGAAPASTFGIYQRDVSGWSRVSALQPTDDIVVSTQGAPADMNGGLITIGARLTGEPFDFTTSTAYIFSAPALTGTVPAVTTWGIVVMALMIMTAATWIVRRRVSMA